MDLVRRVNTRASLKVTFILLMVIMFTACNSSSENIHKGAEVETAIVDDLPYSIIANDYSLYCDDGKNVEKIFEDEIIDLKVYDIDKDGDDELVVMDSVNENLILFEIEARDDELLFEEIYRKDFSEIGPWMVEAGDVDGDGTVEIFVGVNKRTEFYEDIRNRPFYYSWDGQRLQKKWTGSYFSEKDLIDVKFADLFESGRDETIALEKDSQGKYVVSIYGWLGFGFVKIAESGPYDQVDNLVISERENGLSYIEIDYISDNQTIREEVEFFE